MDLEGGNPRQEIQQEIRELERENAVLTIAIEEGDVVSDGLRGRFWEIQKRTFAFLKQTYVEEACAAAQTPGQSPNFFLGRVANIDDVFNIIENNFVQGKEKATQRKEANLQRIQDLKKILDNKSGEGYTGGTGEI